MKYLVYCWGERWELPQDGYSHAGTFVGAKQYVGSYPTLEEAIQADRKWRCKILRTTPRQWSRTEMNGEVINSDTGEIVRI